MQYVYFQNLLQHRNLIIHAWLTANTAFLINLRYTLSPSLHVFMLSTTTSIQFVYTFVQICSPHFTTQQKCSRCYTVHREIIAFKSWREGGFTFVSNHPSPVTLWRWNCSCSSKGSSQHMEIATPLCLVSLLSYHRLFHITQLCMW